MDNASFFSVELMASGTWQAFERALLRWCVHQGFEWSRLTGGAGDRGSDVVGYYKHRYWVLQSKFSLSGTPPGPAVVTQELGRALEEYGATYGVLATNAFLTDAQRLKEAAIRYNTMVGVHIDLAGRSQLMRIGAALPAEPAPRAIYPIREYQTDAVAKVVDASMTRVGDRAGAIVAMATGTGKSRVLFEFIRRFLDYNPSVEVLVLAETVELARQLERTSWETFPKSVTTHLWAGGETPAFRVGNAVTFATTDSVRAGTGILARPGRFALVAFDEAHHAAAAGNAKLIADLQPRFRLGMTATPWRGDTSRLESVFGPHRPVFELSIVDAIRRHHLADVEYVVFDDHIDWDYVTSVSKNNLTIRDLNVRLWIPERENRVASIVRDWVDKLTSAGVPPRTLVFCRSIEHAHNARMALNAAGVPAAELHSGMGKFDTTRILQQFRDGDIRVLAVVDMLNEGIDVPDVRLIVFNRVTHSRRVFLQQLGRGLRPAADKTRLVVLDFVADVRRLAELMEMEAEYEGKIRQTEVVDLPESMVHLQGEHIRRFVDTYLADVSKLRDADDTLLLFPANEPPRN
ncbi:MAG TPA: DEAD/DEAH box helicase family protein [Candidatus Dormibacteraeota bacterium]|nr:DEAD/DEAH box helicase family protein [Candidatus Dormibacteraeota bacterium]